MTEEARPSRRALVLLFVVACLPYLNGLTGDFTYDDKLIIRDNPRLASPAQLPDIFTTHYFGGPLNSATAYRPLVLVTYAVQKWLHGNWLPGFHVVNVLLHAASTVLLFVWLCSLGFSQGPCLAVGALFGVLTIHVEAVTGLVGRAEVLASLLVFLSALLFVRATEGERVVKGKYALCLGAFLASVFVKENAIVLPGAVILGELFRGGGAVAASPARLRTVLWNRRFLFLGFLLPIAVLFSVRRLVLKGFLISKQAGVFDLENPLVVMTPLLRMGNAASIVFRYAVKTLVPTGLAADHSAYAFPLASALGEPRAYLGFLGIALALATAFALLKRAPLAAFGILFFLGTLLPTANILFPVGTIYAERLAYLPSAGILCAAVGLSLPATRFVKRPLPVPWRGVLVGTAVVVLAVVTWRRNRVFESDTALYADMILKVPNSAKAHYDFAYDSMRLGRKSVAREHLETAVRIFPRYYDAWGLLGRLHWEEGRLDDAIRAYRRSVEIFPHYENGRWGLAKTLQESCRTEAAARAFSEGVAELPESYPLAYHHAGFLEEQGLLLEAEKEWTRALVTGKGSSLAHLGKAGILVKLGREEQAWDEARRALVGDPAFKEARYFLADRYALSGKTLAACAELARAYRSHPGDADAAARLLEFGLAHSETRPRAMAALPAMKKSFGWRPRNGRVAFAMAAFASPDPVKG